MMGVLNDFLVLNSNHRLFKKQNTFSIEGILAAEETRGHQIYYRFVGDDNGKRFVKGRAIS